MWGSSVTREHLLQKITLLAILGSTRDRPKQHILVSPPSSRSSLTIEQEQEIISNLAFLSSRSKNCKRVIAVGIEEERDGQGMVIRMAINGGDKDVSHTEEGLVQISKILEQISRREQTEAEDRKTLLRLVISVDFPRIFNRLRLGTKYDIAASHIMLLYRTLHCGPILGIGGDEIRDLQEISKTLLDLFQRLKSSPLPQQNLAAYDIMEQIVTLGHGLNQSPHFSVALTVSPILGSEQRIILADTVSKLGQYYKASSELVSAARRTKCRIFQRIRVERFQTNVPDNIQQPSEPGSAIPLINYLLNLPDSSQLLGRFRGSKSFSDDTILRHLNNSRSGIKVHAEIKLLFFYETHPENIRPRIICASKNACFLCDLFIKVHGKFQTPGTFGKFSERWILPDWLDTIPSTKVPQLRNTIEQFSAMLDSEIGIALKSSKRLPNPLESTVGLSAQWSDSPASYSLVSSIPGSRPGLGLLKPTNLVSSPHSTLIPTSSASTLSSKRFWQYEKLTHGKHIWERLPKNENSFTVEFHEFYAVVSLSVPQNLNDKTCTTLWVCVRLLNLAEQSRLGSENENVVSLENIREGVEEEVPNVKNHPQTRFCIRWNQEMISIQYSTVGPSRGESTSSSNRG